MKAGDRIEITVEDNLRVSVRDYGRGIPQGKMIEAVSVLNTGGKYDSKAFKKSIGLNGVGVKAVNALSTHFEVCSYRDGKVRKAIFERGKLVSDVTEDTQDENGTYIYFEPDNDPKLFKDYQFHDDIVENMLRNYTYLNTGLAIMYNGRRILSRHGLEDLLKEPALADAPYKIVHFESPDRRGIDCALLYNPKRMKVVDTACLPYDFNIDDYYEAGTAKVYQMAYVDTVYNQFIFDEMADNQMEAGKPYMIVVNRGEIQFDAV